jgi:hypothetical protein
LFVVLLAAVNLLIGGYQAWLVVFGVAVLVVAAWARWIAPNASHRLKDPELFVAEAGLFVSVGALMAVAGRPWVGLVFAALTTGVFALTRSDRMP